VNEKRYRWREDARIVQIVPAPAGWTAVTRKPRSERKDVIAESVHDLAYFEPIACFALIEVIEREEVFVGMIDGEYEDWQSTGRTEMNLRNAGGEEANHEHFPTTFVRVIALHTGEAALLPDSSDIADSRFDLILGPDTVWDDDWVRDALK